MSLDLETLRRVKAELTDSKQRRLRSIDRDLVIISRKSSEDSLEALRDALGQVQADAAVTAAFDEALEIVESLIDEATP